MPLSEDEQRILHQIEEQLQRDPGFGCTLHSAARSDRRTLAVASVAAIACLILTIALLSISPYLSFVAFIGAVVAGLFAERFARRVGEAGLNQLSETMRGRFGQQQRTRADD